MLVAIATEYNNALLVIENANIGWNTIQVVIDKGYTNLYYSPKGDAATNADSFLAKGYDIIDTTKMVPGFTMSMKTRPSNNRKIRRLFKRKINYNSRKKNHRRNAYFYLEKWESRSTNRIQ
jgi:hypothetical protein